MKITDKLIFLVKDEHDGEFGNMAKPIASRWPIEVVRGVESYWTISEMPS